MYIDGMPENVRWTKTRLFADDILVYLTTTPEIDATHLQEDLNQLALWKEIWKMKFHPEKCYFLTISRKNQPIIKKIHSSNSWPPTRTGYNSEISRYFNNLCHKSDLMLHYFVHVLVSFTETLKRCSVTSYFYTRSVPLWTQSQLQYWSVLFLLINYFV